MSETSYQNQPKVRSVSTARWAVVTILAIVAVGLIVELGRDMSSAHGQAGDLPAPAASKSTSPNSNFDNIIAVPGPIGRDSFGLYIIDKANKTIALYQYQGKNLRWLSSRNFTYDLQIEDYNTQISPKEVKKLSEQARPINHQEQ